MNLRDMAKRWLVVRGYEGLYHPSGECACRLEDLMPCGEPSPDCSPGYLAPCPGSESEICGGDCGFHIVQKRPKKDIVYVGGPAPNTHSAEGN